MTNEAILKKEMQNQNAVSILYEDNGQHGTLKSAKNIVLDAMDAAREDEAIRLAEWIDNGNWWSEDGLWSNEPEWQNLTATQLYHLYKKQNP